MLLIGVKIVCQIVFQYIDKDTQTPTQIQWLRTGNAWDSYPFPMEGGYPSGSPLDLDPEHVSPGDIEDAVFCTGKDEHRELLGCYSN